MLICILNTKSREVRVIVRITILVHLPRLGDMRWDTEITAVAIPLQETELWLICIIITKT